MKNLFFFLVQILVVVLASFLLGGKTKGLFHQDSMALIFLPQLSLLVIQCGFVGTIHFLKRLMSGTEKAEDQTVLNQISTLGFLQGALGCVLGLMYAMGHLDDGEGLGKGAGFAMSALIYGAYPAILALPFNSKPPKVTAGLYCLAAVLGSMTMALIVLQALLK